MKLLSLLHGARPPILNVVGAWLFGVFFGGYILSISFYEMPLSLLFFLLAFDLSAGLASNATDATRLAWRNLRRPWAIWAFILGHILVYPPLIFWLAAEDVSLIILMHAMLLAKLLLFAGGQLGKGAKIR